MILADFGTSYSKFIDLAAPTPEEAKRDPAGSLQGFDIDGDTFTISDDPDKQE